MSNKKWKMGQIFVAFSEYLNFKFRMQLQKGFDHIICYASSRKEAAETSGA
jgi:hypothetical protein